MPAPRSLLDADGLYAHAVKALAARSRTEFELRRLLRRRARGAADVDAALARLRDHGYLDDGRVAQSAALYQKEALGHGPARALRDLRTRGVSAATAERAVRQSYAGSNEDALLRAYLRRKRIAAPADLRRAAATFRRLRAAGFSPAACQRALRAWKLDPEWLDVLAAAGDEEPAE